MGDINTAEGRPNYTVVLDLLVQIISDRREYGVCIDSMQLVHLARLCNVTVENSLFQ